MQTQKVLLAFLEKRSVFLIHPVGRVANMPIVSR